MYWRINDEPLDAEEGTVGVAGTTVRYERDEARLVLRLEGATAPIELLLGVRVMAHDGRLAEGSRCETFEPMCERIVRAVPTFADYRRVYAEQWGTGMLAVDAPVVRSRAVARTST